MSTNCVTVRGCLLRAQNHWLFWRMVVFTSAGYHHKCEPDFSFARLPRSPAVMSGQLNLSGDVGSGMTLHSVVRPTPPSLPTQRTSGPLPMMTALDRKSTRVSSSHLVISY